VRALVGIAIAGALGALARYGLGAAISDRFPGFPWGTLAINVTGSFILGLLFVILTERTTTSAAVRSAITIGFVGAYTTFSTFSLETVRLLEDGSIVAGTLNVAGNLVLGIAAAWGGIALARAL
jgi:fluoride exporter